MQQFTVTVLDDIPIDTGSDQAPANGEDVRVIGVIMAAGLAVPLLFVGAIVVVSLIGIGFVASIGGTDPQTTDARTRKLPVYWTVHKGETYQEIANQTGLTVEQLLTFNPDTDPSAINPGQRLKLRLKVPKAPAKPKGPRYWTVRSGQSFGSIAAETRRSIIRLQELNPELDPAKLQTGDRVRLRR